MSTKFYLRNPQAQLETSINVRTRWKNELMVYSTGKKVRPRDWNENNQRVRKSNPQSTVLNDYLNKEIILISNGLTEFEKEFGTIPSPKQFKTFLKHYRLKSSPSDVASLEPQKTFYSLIDEMIEHHELRLSNKGKAVKHGTYATTLNQTRNVLTEFEMYSQYKITFESINQDFYDLFVDWCFDEKEYSVNNTGKHIKTVRAIMNEANELELTDNMKHKSKKFKVLKEKVYNIYLTEEELDSLFHMDLSENKHLNTARDLFLAMCWTGLRVSDLRRIKLHHIIDEKFFRIETEKTEVDLEIPLNKKLHTILKKHNFELPQLSAQKVNDYIKIVCEIAGFDELQTFSVQKNRMKVLVKRPKYEMVSNHTARRSFATNRYKEGLQSITIMAITGHTTESAFMAYIKATPSDHRKQMEQHYIKQGMHLTVNNG